MLDTNGDGYNDQAIFLFSTLNFIPDTNTLHHTIIGVIQASIISAKQTNINGTTIVTSAAYQYATEDLVSTVTLTTIEPLLITSVTSNEYINTISYQVIG